MPFRYNFRDVKEWTNSTNKNIILNTTSDLAAKYYDAAVEQYCGWYEDDHYGGLPGTLNKMYEADPEFVLGKAFTLQLRLICSLTSPKTDKQLAKELEELDHLIERKLASNKNSVNEHELLNVSVVRKLAQNDLKGATLVLEDLATSYPHDVAALKTNQSIYFCLGKQFPMRNSTAFALKQIMNNSSNNPLHGYVHGLMAFAYEESFQFEEAKHEALEAIALIPHDTWAIHNYAHCLEMKGLADEGIKWMESQKPEWSRCVGLASHQNWHTALFRINQGMFDEVVDLLDDKVLHYCIEDPSTMNLHDAVSMMYRLELIDLFQKTSKKPSDIKKFQEQQQERWNKVYKTCKPHKDSHLLGFNDAHFMMSLLGANDLESAQDMIDSTSDVNGMPCAVTVVKPLLESMYAFKVKEYTKCASLLSDIRFDIDCIGGSNAQRDVFEQLLLISALKSDMKEHNKLGERMLVEREAFHGKRTIHTQLLDDARLVV